MYFYCVDVSSEEGVYEVECSEGLVLLGKTIPSLPYTNTGNWLLGELGFHYEGTKDLSSRLKYLPLFPPKLIISSKMRKTIAS